MNLTQALARSAGEYPDKTAIFWGDTEFSYQDLWNQVARFGGLLRNPYGVKPGDRVGILLKNRPEYFAVLFGVLHTGAAAVPINHFLKAAEVAFILEDCGIEVLISEACASELLRELQTARPGLRIIQVADWSPGEATAAPPADLSPAREADLACIIYTSGTTGRPKGAMLTHGNLLHNVRSCSLVLEAMNQDRFVLILPMFHSFMLCVGIMLPMAMGASVVLIKSVNQPKTIIQEIVARQATVLPAIPQFFRAMTDPSIPANLPLRVCVSGAAPLPVQVLADFNKKFTVPLLEGYGLSETSPVVSINPIAGPWKAGSIGKPIADVEVRVRGDAGQWLPPGGVGEICVRGGNVMRGYWNQPEATAEALIDGWLLTGDVGYGDADGYFFITDRKKDMLLVNGINVYPREIEELIYQYPGIREAAVVGLPEPRKGEQPVAWIALQNGAVVHEKELFHYLRARLADYKVPRHIHIVAALPRNATGKILKTELRKLGLTGEGQPG